MHFLFGLKQNLHFDLLFIWTVAGLHYDALFI